MSKRDRIILWTLTTTSVVGAITLPIAFVPTAIVAMALVSFLTWGLS